MASIHVVNVRVFKGKCLYLGRAGFGRKAHPLANPERIEEECSLADRISNLERYAERVQSRSDLDLQLEIVARYVRVSGLPLGCWCQPLPCHADIVAALAEQWEVRNGLRDPSEASSVHDVFARWRKLAQASGAAEKGSRRG
jgi:hypothetical protein